ncbi:MAG TPA: hypothetical protein VF787_23910 [Thermoanaerobaculia bacterium]
MKRTLAAIALLFAFTATASPTRNNDDSCDISVLPAATLLLPYFEVNLHSYTGPTTLFTVTNAGPQEQIAHVTLWTDYAYPVIDFNVYLTGYDTQAINLFDIIARGFIAPDLGTGTDVSNEGDFSTSNARLDLSACAQLAGQLPAAYVTRMQQAFTLGRVPALGTQPACTTVGGIHTNAVGYATIDVVRSCTTRNPSMGGYLTEDILWDNVLLGDYQQIDSAQNYAEGGPMVHVRAIPEGGTASERRNYPGQYEVTFHRTFYSRFQAASNHTFDARQPLPATFAARWIDGTSAGFRTSLKIWREGRTTLNAPCSTYAPQNVAGFLETVIFDEEENPEAVVPTDVICTPIILYPTLPATSMVRSNDQSVFPRPTTGSIGGWIYLNLDNCWEDDYASQNWVITSMRSEGRYSLDQDAFALGNGCSLPVDTSEVTNYYGGAIGPAANVNP